MQACFHMLHRTHLPTCLTALFLLCLGDSAAGQVATAGPDRWSATSSSMMYFTMLEGRVRDLVIVQCVGGQWSFGLGRPETDEDYPFGGPDPLSGWWQVDDEPPRGPIPLGMRSTAATLTDEALTARLRQPVRESIRFRILLGEREWLFELGPERLAEAVAVFDPSCAP